MSWKKILHFYNAVVHGIKQLNTHTQLTLGVAVLWGKHLQKFKGLNLEVIEQVSENCTTVQITFHIYL